MGRVLAGSVHLEGIPGRTRAKTPKLERPGVQLGQWAHGGGVALQSNHDSPDLQNMDISGTNNLEGWRYSVKIPSNWLKEQKLSFA